MAWLVRAFFHLLRTSTQQMKKVLLALFFALAIQGAELGNTFLIAFPKSPEAGNIYGLHMTNRAQRLALAKQIEGYLGVLDEVVPSLNSTDQQWVKKELTRTVRLLSERDPSRLDENRKFQGTREYKIWVARLAIQRLRPYVSRLVSGKPTNSVSTVKAPAISTNSTLDNFFAKERAKLEEEMNRQAQIYTEAEEISDWHSFANEMLTTDLWDAMAELKVYPPPLKVNGKEPMHGHSIVELGFVASEVVASFIHHRANHSENP